MSNETEMTVLSSTSREGQFVHENQTMSADVDFKNVSRIWYDKTITFEQGREKMADQRKEREDIEFSAADVEFSADEKGIIVKIDDRDFRPTSYAMAKLCSWFETPQTMASYYLNPPNNGKYDRNQTDYDLLCYALEVGQPRVVDKDGNAKELLFRTYKDGTLRAVMSDSYSIVDNDWYLDLLSKLIPGGRLSHWCGDADTIYGNVIIPDSIRAEKDSDYGGMLSLSNSEIGRRQIAQTPSIFWAICMNGCIWGQTEGIQFKKRHKGINLEDLAEDIKANIMKQIPLMTGAVDTLLATRQWQIETKATKIFAAIQQVAKITPSVAMECRKEYMNQGKQGNAYGIIDAITRTSQLQEPDEYVKMDTFAATLLNRKTFDFIQHTAKGMSDEAVAKALGVAI